ncbi:MAG: hypothetical protein ACKODX_21450, partial [Gemmata sp.]
LAGAAASWGPRGRGPRAVLTHVSLLVLGPVAVNPYLEAYHLVPLVVPALVLLAVATDRTRPTAARALAAVGFAVGLAVLKASSPWPLRGLQVNVQALVLCGTAVCVTWVPAGPAVPRGAAREGRRGRFVAVVGRLASRARV